MDGYWPRFVDVKIYRRYKANCHSICATFYPCGSFAGISCALSYIVVPKGPTGVTVSCWRIRPLTSACRTRWFKSTYGHQHNQALTTIVRSFPLFVCANRPTRNVLGIVHQVRRTQMRVPSHDLHPQPATHFLQGVQQCSGLHVPRGQVCRMPCQRKCPSSAFTTALRRNFVFSGAWAYRCWRTHTPDVAQQATLATAETDYTMRPNQFDPMYRTPDCP